MFKKLRHIFGSVRSLAGWDKVGKNLPSGDGHPVLILPGFLTNDTYMGTLHQRIKAQGYDVHTWDHGINLGLDEKTAAHLRKRLEEIYKASGKKKVSLVGYSLGGIYARELARECPHMVRDVITLGAPFGLSHRKSAVADRMKKIYGYFNAGNNHLSDDELLKRSLTPPPVPATSIYSREDGVVDFRASLNPLSLTTENIEVISGHITMPFDPLSAAAVLDRLAQQEGNWKPFDRSAYPDLGFPAPVTGKVIPANPGWTQAASPAKPIFKKKK